MSVVYLQNEAVHYEVIGRGRPLIFLHGWIGSWRYWLDSMQAASISFRAYAIDLWGFGDSAKARDYYSLDQQLNLVDLFMQEMGIGKVALVGHGLGAVVALVYAHRYRQLVDRLLTISLPPGTAAIKPGVFNTHTIQPSEWLLSSTTGETEFSTETVKTDPNAVQAGLASLQHLDILGLAQGLFAPCLLVYGQGDQTLELSVLPDPIASLPAHAHQVIFDQSGYFPMLDEPGKFHRLVADFLSLKTGESPRQLQLKEEWKRRVR